MYLFEQGIWQTATESPAKRAEEEENIRKVLGEEALRESRGPSGVPDGKEWQVMDRVEVAPTDACAVYSVNDRYMDVRASWMEEKRGLITFLFLGFGALWLGYLLFAIEVSRVWFTGIAYSSFDASSSDYFFSVFLIAVNMLIAYAVKKFLWRWIHLELFTQRHVIARFNRVTRQVHLNRPKYAGGIVTFPWESTLAGVDPDLPDHEGIGSPLLLVWPLEYNGAGYDELAFLGEPMDGNRQVLGLWEYIRRYMEEGPQAIPPPKRLRPLFPWPWESVRATLSFMAPVWRRGGKMYALAIGLLLSPLMLLHALCHWVSLLLCWPTRWPKEIAQAGLPGKPAPKPTVAEDHGAEIGSYLRANAANNRQDVRRKG